MTNVIGMKMNPTTSSRRCDLIAPGHQQMIPAGKSYYKVTSGKAQGTFHGPRCYQEALKQYLKMEEEMKLKREAQS